MEVSGHAPCGSKWSELESLGCSKGSQTSRALLLCIICTVLIALQWINLQQLVLKQHHFKLADTLRNPIQLSRVEFNALTDEL